jgi:hypothetical protein
MASRVTVMLSPSVRVASRASRPPAQGLPEGLPAGPTHAQRLEDRPGRYRIYVGTSSRDLRLQTSVHLR